MHDSKLEEIQEPQENKFNVDAIQILEDIKRECSKHIQCKFCAFGFRMKIDSECPFIAIPAEWELNHE